MRNIADDKSIVIKKADKGSCAVVWGREDYLKEASGQLNDIRVYKDVKYNENILPNLVDRSNKLFRDLKNMGFITEKELK